MLTTLGQMISSYEGFTQSREENAKAQTEPVFSCAFALKLRAIRK